MAEELDSESWFELKPIEFRGRVWPVSEWAPILGFIVIVVNGMVFSILWGLIELALLLALIGHLQSRSEGPVYGSDSTEPLESGQVTESKLPSKAEAAEWAKQNSEYFLAWNKRKYAASKTWLGQKREDFAEWRHQRKLARYRIVAMPDQGVITAVDDVMEPSEDALEEDAMAKMLVDTDSEPAEAVPEEVEETQTIVIPTPPVFSSSQTPPGSTPRAPLVDYDRVPAYLRKATRIFYGVLLAFYALAMFNFAYDIGLFDFFYSDFVVERFMGEYPGTQIGVKPRAIILGTLFLCTSLLMLIGYRPFVTMFILASALIFSIMLSMILWPLALFSLAALASADLRAEWGLPADFDSGALSGQIFQGILFGLAIVSTTAVYKFDREARDAPMYAKEMEAYVKHMEHWININNDFYEREHARLTAGLDASSDEE